MPRRHASQAQNGSLEARSAHKLRFPSSKREECPEVIFPKLKTGALGHGVPTSYASQAQNGRNAHKLRFPSSKREPWGTESSDATLHKLKTGGLPLSYVSHAQNGSLCAWSPLTLPTPLSKRDPRHTYSSPVNMHAPHTLGTHQSCTS